MQRKMYPIQCKGVRLLELFVRDNAKDEESSVDAEDKKFSLAVGHSEYDQDSKEVLVWVKLEIGRPSSDEGSSSHPVDIRVKMLAQFEAEFDSPPEWLNDWLENYSPFVLYPYLRQHVYSLSSQVGPVPILLPLLEVPTITIAEK